jgi:hypothetical protein
VKDEFDAEAGLPDGFRIEDVPGAEIESGNILEGAGRRSAEIEDPQIGGGQAPVPHQVMDQGAAHMPGSAGDQDTDAGLGKHGSVRPSS